MKCPNCHAEMRLLDTPPQPARERVYQFGPYAGQTYMSGPRPARTFWRCDNRRCLGIVEDPQLIRLGQLVESGGRIQ